MHFIRFTTPPFPTTMAITTRRTLLENRRFLWTASITFALAAIVFPIVILAASGHFSSSKQTLLVRSPLFYSDTVYARVVLLVVNQCVYRSHGIILHHNNGRL